ncbi:hypothetical protein BDV06DRAFT_198163, partial [Aspergillus oleicola]
MPSCQHIAPPHMEYRVSTSRTHLMVIIVLHFLPFFASSLLRSLPTASAPSNLLLAEALRLTPLPHGQYKPNNSETWPYTESRAL